MANLKIESVLWFAAGVAVLWLIHRLGPILSPFLLAAILAYVCSPLVERLAGRGLPRSAAVLLVMAALILLVVSLVLIIVPVIRDEGQLLVDRLPDFLGMVNDQALPWLQEHTGLRLKLKFSPIETRQLIANNMGSLEAVAQKVIESALTGGQILLGIVATLLLAPVAMFYLLRDWHSMGSRISDVLPQAWRDRGTRLGVEVDRVLAEFLRGQLAVMALMAAYYSLALWIAGLDYALPLGLVTGLLVFIPYVGFITGLILSLLVAALELQGWGPIAGVAVVYGIGQVLESMLLTPYLVGERIGLHPLAVIFALLAFGELFGFFGVLLALPVSAALLVGLRHLHAEYLRSHIYRGETL